MQKRSGSFILIAATLILFMVSATVWAEYPEKPIQMVVGYQVGGNIDAIARGLSKIMGTSLGQPVVVENKAGAGGGVAAAFVKTAKPDGYTLCLATTVTYAFDPLMGSSVYTAEDFDYIAEVVSGPVAIVSSAEMPWQDWKAMVAEGKKRKLNYASLIPIDKLMIKSMARQDAFQYSAIPTKGGAEIITAILGKHVDFGVIGPIYHSYVKSGQMRALAMLGKKRSPYFPDVPTLQELGYDLSLNDAIVITAPKHTPPAIVKKLSDAIQAAIKSPEFVGLIETKLNWLPAFLDANETTQDVLSQRTAYQGLIQEQGK